MGGFPVSGYFQSVLCNFIETDEHESGNVLLHWLLHISLQFGNKICSE